jgi:hypothetical protein
VQQAIDVDYLAHHFPDERASTWTSLSGLEGRRNDEQADLLDDM